MEKTKTAAKPEKLYKDGYAAFEKGNYEKAISRATECLNLAEIGSYWYPGALALRCWAANCHGDRQQAVRDAYMLLSIDSGDDKMWFDGTALLNLGLMRRRDGDVEEAGILFQIASERYAAYHIDPNKPTEWHLIRDLFAAACFWAAQGKTDKLDELADHLKKETAAEAEVGHIKKAVDLYLRAAGNENVLKEAEAATARGVSRAFVALLLT